MRNFTSYIRTYVLAGLAMRERRQNSHRGLSLVLMLSLGILVSLATNAQAPTPDVIYYTFDGTGTTVPNLATAPPSGTATGTLMGSITQGGAGLCGGAVIGSGNASSTDYVNTGWAPNLTGSWTFSFWSSNITGTSTLYYIFGDANSNSFRCFTNGVAGANNWILRGAGLTDVLLSGGATAAPHLNTFVYDQVSNNVYAYLDGVLVNTVAQSAPSIVGVGPFKFVGYSTNVGAPAGGLYDEFRVYSRALSASEVTSLTSGATYIYDTITATACSSYTSPSGHYTYTSSGTYYDTTGTGCSDTLYTLNLTINQGGTSAQAFTICSGQSVSVNGHTYSSAGTYMDTIVGGSVNGCDSIITSTVTMRGLTALNFQSASNTSVQIPSNPQLQITGALTLECWFRTNAVMNDNKTLVSKWHTGGSVGFGSYTILWVPGSGLSFWIQNTAAADIQLGSGADYNDNVWHHVAGTWDGTVAKIYIDGVLMNSVTNPAFGALEANNLNVVIGSDAWGGAGRPYTGDIDEVRIWSRALCQAEINLRKGCELTGTQDNLVAYYQLNDGVPNANNAGLTTAADSSGHGFNGTLNNFTLSGTTANWVDGTVSCPCPALVVPSVSITAAASSICPGSTTTFTASATNAGSSPSYQWYQNGVAAGTNSNTFTPATMNPQDSVWTVVTSSDNCLKDTSNHITVTQLPAVNFTQSPVICQGQTFTVLSHTYSTTNTYRDTIFGGSVTGCDSVIITNLTVNPTPAVNPTPDQTVCNANPTTQVVFTGSQPNTVYSWTYSTAIGQPATSGQPTLRVPVAALATTGPAFGTNLNNAYNGAGMLTYPSMTAAHDGSFLNNSFVYAGVANTITFDLGSNVGVNALSFWNQNNGGPSASGTNGVKDAVLSYSTDNITYTPLFGGTTTFTQATGDTSIPDKFNFPVVNARYFKMVVSSNYGAPGVTGFAEIAFGYYTDTLYSFTAVNATNAPKASTVTVTPSLNMCTGTPSTFTITVNPTPKVNPTADQTVCNNGMTAAVTFSGPVPGTTYSWTGSDGTIGLATSGNGNIASFTATNTGTAPVTDMIIVTPSYTNNAVTCTGTPDTFYITVNPTPAVNPTADLTLCNNSASGIISFSSPTAGTTYSWTGSDGTIGLATSGNGDIASFTATNTGTTPVTDMIIVTPSYTNNSVTCSGTPDTFYITVNPTPTVNPSSDQTVCNTGATTTVSFTGAVAGTVFSWTGSDGTIGLATSGNGDIASFTATNTGTTPVTDMIIVTPSYTNNSVTCSGAPDTFYITVNPTPTVNPSADQTICNNGATTTVSFTGAVAGTSYDWTGSDGTIGLATSGNGDIASFTATNTGTTPVTDMIIVTPSYTNNGVTCSGTPDTFYITVNPTPTVNPSADQTVCNTGATTTVSFTGAVAGTVFSWTGSDGTIGLATSGNGDIASFTATNTGTVPVTDTIIVTPSYTNNSVTCSGTPDTFYITVNPTPTVNPSADQTVCNNGATAIVSFTGAVAGTSYDWTGSDGTIGLATSGNGDIASFTATNTGTVPVTDMIIVTPSYTNNSVTCSGTPDTFYITVNPTPVVNPSADVDVCNGAVAPSVAFTGPVSGTVYDWTSSDPSIGLATSGTGDLPSFTAVNNTTSDVIDTVIVTPSYTNNGVTCTGTSDTFFINVHPTPLILLGGPVATCGGSVQIDAGNAGSTYAWSDGPTTQIDTVSTSGVYTVTVTSPFGCIDSASKTVYIRPAPVVNLGPDQTNCNVGVTLDAGNPGAAYLWSTGATTQQIVATVTGDYSVIVTDTASRCGGTDTVHVTINGNPVVDLGPDTTLCGGTLTLTAGDLTNTYLWSPGGSTGNTLTVSTTGTYAVTVTSPTGCTATDDIHVTLFSKPNLGADISDSICPGSKADLYSYYQGTGVTLTFNTPTPASVDSGTYTVIGTNANGCSDTAIVTIAYRLKPDLGPDVTDSICQGYTYNLENLFPSGRGYSSYAWSGTFTDTAVGPGVYTLVVSNASGCTDTVTVTILTRQRPNLGGNKTDSVCVGSTYDLTTLYPNSGYASYHWTGVADSSAVPAGTYQLVVSNGSGCTDTAYAIITNRVHTVVTLNTNLFVCSTVSAYPLTGGSPSGGSYYVNNVVTNTFDPGALGAGPQRVAYVYTNGSGCTDSAVTTITVYPQPNITNTTLPVVCNNSQAVNLDNYFNPFGGSYTGPGVSGQYFYPSLAGPGNSTITYIYTDSHGCSDTGTAPITVTNAVSVSLHTTNVNYTACALDSVTFIANGAQQYQFFVNGVAVTAITDTNTFTTTSLQNHDQVTVVGSNACSSDTSDFIIIDINERPVAYAGMDTTIDLGQVAQLHGSATGGVGNYTYSWTPGTFLDFNNVPNPKFNGPDTTLFTLRVTDVNGCWDTATVTVNVRLPQNIQLPNILTPNGDGQNDIWVLNPKIDLTGSNIVIFNRWGEKVYEATPYANDWNGTYMGGGEKLPDGTYYYVLKVPAQNTEYKGPINILSTHK
ncbi:MAG: gliding motility-associated C-terminal domain-containing protein [Bacteroidetes bacterium]|nr:gliding motility-associated C-terminal domain-containing protein [Bacteroidota bacterium]